MGETSWLYKKIFDNCLHYNSCLIGFGISLPELQAKYKRNTNYDTEKTAEDIPLHGQNKDFYSYKCCSIG
jgi:hypothetical protein